MMGRFRKLDMAGFSLVETLAALLIFGIVTLGLIPLIGSSLRGSNVSRSYTVAKSAVTDAMERLRGLPYNVPNTDQPLKNPSGTACPTDPANCRPVDMLDMYFPKASSTGLLASQAYNGAANVWTFTNTCSASVPTDPANSAYNPACPTRYPSLTNFTLRYVAQFQSASNATREVYSPSQPPATYSWNALGNDNPPAQQMKMTITASWNITAGAARSYSISTLVGDRKYGELKLSAYGRLDYAVKVGARYNVSGQFSELTGTFGQAETRVQTRLISTTDESVRAGQLALRDTGSADPISADVVLEGNNQVFRAAPDHAASNGSAVAQGPLGHFDLGNQAIGALDATTTTGASAAVTGSLPAGGGTFAYPATAGNVSAWMTNQADTAAGNPLQLVPGPSGAMVWVQPSDGSGRYTQSTLTGTSFATTTTQTAPATRKVETGASAAFASLKLLPTSFIPSSPAGGAVAEIRNFSASVLCRSTANAAGTVPGTATGTWSATLSYWSAGANNDPTDDGYVDLPLGSSDVIGAGADPLDALKATPPLVYDAPGGAANDALDVYLFPTATNPGYFAASSATQRSVNVDPPAASGNDVEANSSIDNAIRLDTAQLNPAVGEDSAFTIAVGRMSCQAIDRR